MKTPFLSCRFWNLLILSLFLGASLHAESPLETQMKQMKSAFKELGKSLQQPVDADKDKYLALTAKLREATVKSRELSPEKTDEIPADQKAAFLKNFQKKIDETVATIDLLSQAIKASNWPEAQKQYASLKGAQKEGHKEFQSEKS